MASRPKHAEPRPQPRLYLMTPAIEDAAGFVAPLEAALAAGDVAAVLLRLAPGDERALINRIKHLAPILPKADAALVLADLADLVARSGADGAHLTGVDAFIEALPMLKPDRIAGCGGLDTRHDAMRAAEQGADYVMFGEPGRARRSAPPSISSRNASPGGPRCSRRPASPMPTRPMRSHHWSPPAPISSRSANGSGLTPWQTSQPQRASCICRRRRREAARPRRACRLWRSRSPRRRWHSRQYTAATATARRVDRAAAGEQCRSRLRRLRARLLSHRLQRGDEARAAERCRRR